MSWPGNGLRETDVPCEVLEEAFEKSGLSLTQLARRMGYFRQIPNTEHAQRVLGRRGQQYVRYDTALKFCEALGLDPVDLDL